MSTTDNTTVVACRCPECGAIVADRVNIFKLNGDSHVIRCKVCGTGYMTITMSADSKIRLNVPCLVCPHHHPYTIGTTSFFNKDLFLLQCSYSGLDTCFIGTEEKVDEALRMNAAQLKEIYEANSKELEAENFLEATVMEGVLARVEELAITNKIRCGCENGEPNLAIVVDYDKIRLSCKDCGNKEIIYATEKSDVTKMEETKILYLK